MRQDPTLPALPILPKIALWIGGAWLAIELMRGGIPWTPAFGLSLACIWALSAASPKGLWNDHPGWGVFLVCLAAYLSTFRWHGGDDITNSLLPLALLKHGTLALTPVIDPFLTGKTNEFTLAFGDQLISIHPIAGGLLALPVYLIPALAHAPISETFIHNLSKVSASLITAASAAVFYAAVEKKCSKAWALSLAFFYGLGSFSFSVSSQALWQHGPAQLGIGLALLGLSRTGFKASLLAGFGMGLSFAARTDSAFFVAAMGAYVLFHDPKRLAGICAGALVPFGFLAGYWLYYTGRLVPPESGHHAGLMKGLQPGAILGLILSPTRGLLFFCPAAFFGVWVAIKSAGKDRLNAWLLTGCLATWALVSSYYSWVGGMSFGPRYFAVVVMVLLFLCAGAEDDIRSSPLLLKAWVAAGVFAVLVHALGGYFNWPGSFGVSYARAEVWRFSLHPAAFMFAAKGPLGGLPGALRGLVGLMALSGFAEGARRLHRALKKGS